MENQTNENLILAFEEFYASEDETQNEIIQQHVYPLLRLAFKAGWDARETYCNRRKTK
jgi:hypothetical protein